ncbi:hypothetical protein HU200_012428 [Digitaria exilis]|uniref:Uncharacterized protein n=1 Tax=Digitaria exilis TaxID=1010633 RepID=A0A835KLU5_9POAL|nr:hypothetical protein HU200_012428 [Digitaria exilis]
MASSLVHVIPVLLLLLLLLVVCPYSVVSASRYGPSRTLQCYKHLFSLGDSITDTGNIASIAPNNSVMAFPYGETFFHRPTDRFCDGRLILPFLTPFLIGKTAVDFRQGANLAVQQFFKDMGLDVTILPPFSLDVQLEWLNQVLHLLGPTKKERRNIMSRSLFLLGENWSFSDEIRPLVPKVIKKIENATKVVRIYIPSGADRPWSQDDRRPWDHPHGLHSGVSDRVPEQHPDDYDAAGCLRWLNDFAEEHNRALRLMLGQIHRDPAVTVVYADYYGAIMEITRDPLKHGFRKDVALTACCGNGGAHNSGKSTYCNATSDLCPDPPEHISWDGLHLTEAAYEFVARGLLDGPYAAPSILSKCGC